MVKESLNSRETGENEREAKGEPVGVGLPLDSKL